VALWYFLPHGIKSLRSLE